jgi:hypothetical protein
MKSKPEAATLPPQGHPGSAANEPFTGLPGKGAQGWDPYEDWRTRIKALQDKSGPSVAFGL